MRKRNAMTLHVATDRGERPLTLDPTLHTWALRRAAHHCRSLGLAMLAGCALAAPTLAQAADAEQGKVVFDHWCRPCHDVEPRKHPGTAALQVLYKGEKPAALEQRLDLTPELVATYVRNGVSIMPFFRKTEISDEQLRDLGEYLSGGRD